MGKSRELLTSLQNHNPCSFYLEGQKPVAPEAGLHVFVCVVFVSERVQVQRKETEEKKQKGKETGETKLKG